MKRIVSFFVDVGGLLQDLAALIPALFQVRSNKSSSDDTEIFWDTGDKQEEQPLA